MGWRQKPDLTPEEEEEDSKRREKKWKIYKEFAKGIVMLVVYLAIGCLFYKEYEDWTVIECLYFARLTFTFLG
jgi:hypothetical protein